MGGFIWFPQLVLKVNNGPGLLITEFLLLATYNLLGPFLARRSQVDSTETFLQVVNGWLAG